MGSLASRSGNRLGDPGLASLVAVASPGVNLAEAEGWWKHKEHTRLFVATSGDMAMNQYL